jgi:hypothetical protein
MHRLRLGTHIMKDFNAIDPETQPRNVIAWTPVVTEILHGCCTFENDSVSEDMCLENGNELINVTYSSPNTCQSYTPW